MYSIWYEIGFGKYSQIRNFSHLTHFSIEIGNEIVHIVIEPLIWLCLKHFIMTLTTLYVCNVMSFNTIE